jgi:hypothetical protein
LHIDCFLYRTTQKIRLSLMRLLSLIAGLSILASGCGEATEAATDQPRAAQRTESEADLPTVLVYKTPTCGCCNGWVDHLRKAGFEVDARDVSDLALVTMKREVGVTAEMSSCHTALVGGYVVEGHVPADQIKRLLSEEPEVAGITAPGMPIGSPGMEGPGARPYAVYSFDHGGQLRVFAEIDPR